MIEIQKHTLSNGLKIVIHEDLSTPMVAVNVVYNVGSRNEDPHHTGFAHLFEHLMFGGSANVPDFDDPIQDAGGENNAFTNADLTNFYELLPAENIETALWLESDRMMALNMSKKSLKTQKKVVIEEFKETCLNEPYGDMWHHMSQLAYQIHPYKWPTIGIEMSHISDATIEHVESFYKTFYNPNNAAIILCGNISVNKGISLVEKWFGDITPGAKIDQVFPTEPIQTSKRSKYVRAEVPHTAIYRSYHMCARMDDDYYAIDLLSDVLAQGRSSRFYQRLYKDKQLFSTIDAFISGSVDPGLFIIEGKLMPGVAIETALEELDKEIKLMMEELISDRELQKLKNHVESSIAYSDSSILNKALSLAYFEMLGDAALINYEADKYLNVTAEDIKRVAAHILRDENCSELIYTPIN